MIPEPVSWDDLDEMDRMRWIMQVESGLDLRDLFIHATRSENQVLDDLIRRIARERYAEEVC